MSKQYDVFLSHVGAEKDSARRIKHALEKKGLTVWFDEDEINDFASIVKNIQIGLASSKSLLALYSKNYSLRRACQWELTAAYVATQRIAQEKTRILIVNPEESITHIYNPLREFLFRKAPVIGNEQEYEELAESLDNHLSTIEGYLGELLPLIQPRWYGMAGIGSNRFVGRLKEMWDIHAALHASDTVLVAGSSTFGSTHASSVDAVHLRGLGGNGKSLLAEEYALRFGIGYSGGIFWLNAFGNHSIRSKIDSVERNAAFGAQMEVIAKHLGIRTEDYGGDSDYIRGAIGSKIEELGKPCLWIVDDIPSGLSAQELRRFYSPHPLAKTLITTRSQEYDTSGVQLSIAELDKEDAYQLITRGKPLTPIEQVQAKEIVAILGYHALAIDVAGMIVGRWGFESFLNRLNDSRQETDVLELVTQLSEQLPNGHERSIASTLLSSIDELDENGKDFLRLASILTAAPIPKSFIQKVFQTVHSLDEASAEDKAVRSIDQVISLSLAEEKQKDAWEVHLLVSRTIHYMDIVKKSERANFIKASAIKALIDVLSINVDDIRNHDKIVLEMAHARTIIKSLNTLEEISLARLLARYDLANRFYESAEELYREIIKQLQTKYDNNCDEIYECMNELAITLRHVCHFNSAREYQEYLLTISKEKSGDDHPDTLAAMNNLALTLVELGDNSVALQLQERVLDACKRKLGEEHHNTLTAEGNLATTLRDMGKIDSAHKLQENVFRIRKRLFGEEHPDTLVAMNNLATILSKQGELKKAMRLRKKVLDITKRLLGGKHPETLKCMNNLATIYKENGEFKKALQLFKEAIVISSGSLGEDHRDTLNCMNNLAITLLCMNDHIPAKLLQEQILDIRTKKYGVIHTFTTESAWNLYKTLYALGDREGADKVFSTKLKWILEELECNLSSEQRRIRKLLNKIVT